MARWQSSRDMESWNEQAERLAQRRVEREARAAERVRAAAAALVTEEPPKDEA